MNKSKSPVFIIFTTVLVDLIGFGMVIPLVALYGKHYQANSIQLAILASIYSIMQFIFSPFWGALSDRIGRRPILLFSLLGSSITYLIFGIADSYYLLLISRAFGGICAANISTAQAYIADVTPLEKRAHGMGIIGAAFGIGFTLGPPLGALSEKYLGLAGPGLVAAGITGLNFVAALFRLPESLPQNLRNNSRNLFRSPIDLATFREIFARKNVGVLLTISAFVVFAFSHMEQSFSLLFQYRFDLSTEDAGIWTGYVLGWSGILGAIVQGVLIRKLMVKYNELKLILPALLLYTISIVLFPFWPTYKLYFVGSAILALGSGILNPVLSSLISKSANADEQGKVLGLNQSLASLARVLGPFSALPAFNLNYTLPYFIAAGVCLFMAVLFILKKKHIISQN